MPWQRTEARIVEMLQTYHEKHENPVKDLTTWLERQKLILLGSEIRAWIDKKAAPPPGRTVTEEDRRKIEEWLLQMVYRHIKLTELEQEFREIYEADGIDHAVEQTIERPNTVPDSIVELTETKKPIVGAATTVVLQLAPPVVIQYCLETEHSPVVADTSAEAEIPSAIVNQNIEKLLPTGVSRAQPESELIDEEEGYAVDPIDVDYGCPVLGVLPTDRPPPEPSQELMDEEEACAGAGESTIDALPSPLQAMASLHPFYVRKDRASPKSVEELIDEPHACMFEAVLGEYAFQAPNLLSIPPDRPPPKPGEAVKLRPILEPPDRRQR
jgi:hypothetical protein